MRLRRKLCANSLVPFCPDPESLDPAEPQCRPLGDGAIGQVYWEKKRQRIAAQLAQPSKWDEAKYNGSALKRALADTILVDAAWLAQLADRGGVLPRCQEVPTDSVVTLEEMERCNFCFGELLPVLVISCPWLNADHPDEHGVLLQSIKFVLNAFATRAAEEGGKCGVFWDYCSRVAASSNPSRRSPIATTRPPQSQSPPRRPRSWQATATAAPRLWALDIHRAGDVRPRALEYELVVRTPSHDGAARRHATSSKAPCAH